MHFLVLLCTSHSSIENSILTSLMVSSWDGQDVWIGLTDYAQRGAYRWQDKSAVDYSSWLNGEPDDRSRVGSCVRATLQFGRGDMMFWQDGLCSESFAYVCARFRGKCKNLRIRVAQWSLPAPPTTATRVRSWARTWAVIG